MSSEDKYNEWLESIVHLQHKVILPDQHTTDKTRWTSHKGFNSTGFYSYLKDLYEAKYKKDDK